MDKSYKRFGYGFSALVLALSSTVIIPSVANAATPTCVNTTPSGSEVAYKEAKDTASLLTAGVCVKLTADITTDAYPVSDDTVIDLNGYTLSVPITVAEGKTLTIKNGNSKATATLETSITLAKGANVEVSGDVDVKASGSDLITLSDSSVKSTVTIAGGSYTADVLVSAKTAIQDGSIVISGGDFTGVSKFANSAVAAAIEVSAGSIFSADPSADESFKVAPTAGVFTNGSVYAVSTKSTLTADNTTTTMIADSKTAASFFTLTPGAVADGNDGFIMNDVTFTIVDAADDDSEVASGSIADISSYFTVNKVVDEKTKKDDPTDDVYTYKFIANKGGSYKITAKSLDGQEASVTVTVYEFNTEAAFKDIYIAKSSTDTNINIEDAVVAFVGEDNKSNIEIKAGGTAITGFNIPVKTSDTTIEVTYAMKNAADAKGSFNVIVLDEEATDAGTVFVKMVEDEDNGGYRPVKDSTLTLDTSWAIASAKGGAADVERLVDDEGEETANFVITPTAVGTETVTYNLAVEDVWAVNDEGELVTDEADVATALADFKKTATIYTYRVNDGFTLKYTPASGTDDAISTSEQATGIVEVDTDNVIVTATKTSGDGTKVEGIKDAADSSKVIGSTISSIKADEADGYTFTLTAGEKSATVTGVNIYTYSDTTADFEDVISNNEFKANTAVEVFKFATDVNASLKLELVDESETAKVAADGKSVSYTPATTGTETISVNVKLGETVLDTFDIKVNTYGLDLQSVYYVEPGAELTIENVADPFGTVRISEIKDASGDLYTGYSFENGTFTFSADEEGTYSVKFRDSVDISEGTEVNKAIYPEITIKVAETYVTTDTESVALDITDGIDTSDIITVSKTAGTLEAVFTDTDDEKVDSFRWAAVSTKNSTYKITTTNATLPGDYTLTLNLKDSAGNIIDSTEIAINVVAIIDDLPEGVYTISSLLGNNMVLDINGGSTADGGNVQIYKSSKNNIAQQFIIQKSDINDGYYTIKNIHSSKLIDVTAGYAADGTNIQQFDGNDTSSQLWRIQVANGEAANEGAVTFVSALDDSIVLDVAGGVAKNGTNVQAYTSNSTASQQWLLERLETSDEITDIAGNIISDQNVYTITSALNSNMVIDVAGAGTANATNVQLYTANDTVAQEWIFEADEAGLYTITNTNSKKVLDVQWGGSTKGTNVQIYEPNNTTPQKWILTQDSKTGFVTFKSVNSDLVLDIDAGKAVDGTNAQIWPSNGTKSQQFRLVRVK